MKKKLFILLMLLGVSSLIYFSCKKDENNEMYDLLEIFVTPTDTVIEVGTSVQFTAMGLFADSSVKDITGDVTWSASPEGKIEISSGGLATAVDTGEVYIVAGGGFGLTAGSICLSANAAGMEREMVLLKYESEYIGSSLQNCGWTGSVNNCNPGEASQESHNLVVKRINYYRELVGLPGGITLDADKNAKCQEAALIMKANNNLNHFPPSSWTCWTQDGYDAAGNSNIALGMHSVNAVTGYIDDFGANNKDVGHRRWLLFSKAKVMGDGSTDNTNAIWVMGNQSNPLPSPMPEFVAYPPKGYVPGPLVYDRWSFGIPGAGFSAAAVEMKDAANQTVNCSVISRAEGYGDNTIVWEPSGVNTSGPGDVKYTVTVSGVKVGTEDKTFTYSVTIIQPNKSKKDPYLEAKKVQTDWRIL